MADSNAAQVSNADVQSLRSKLQEFATGLTPGEQVVLGILLEHVHIPEAETSGFVLGADLGGAILSAFSPLAMDLSARRMDGGLQARRMA